jgi:hypothetical protein
MTAYSTRHTHVRNVRGPASAQTCVTCRDRGEPRPARDWACIHGHDGEDPFDYVALCKRCHISYDKSGHYVPHSEATKQLLREKNTGYQHTPEAVEKIRAESTGRTLSAEAKAKVSAAHKGQVVSAEQREQISRTLRGNVNASGKRSEQALENIRRGQRERRARERG